MEEKRPEGRPTVMDENTIKILEENFSVGASNREACFMANISEATLYNYIEKHPEFLERKEQLKDLPKLKAKKVVMREIEKNNSNVAQWYLEKKDDDFNPKTKVDAEVNLKKYVFEIGESSSLPSKEVGSESSPKPKEMESNSQS